MTCFRHYDTIKRPGRPITTVFNQQTESGGMVPTPKSVSYFVEHELHFSCPSSLYKITSNTAADFSQTSMTPLYNVTKWIVDISMVSLRSVNVRFLKYRCAGQEGLWPNTLSAFLVLRRRENCIMTASLHISERRVDSRFNVYLRLLYRFMRDILKASTFSAFNYNA